MKTNILKLTAMLLLLAGSLVSCEDKGKESLFPEPVEIPCTEYLLPEADCRWINTSSDRVIVINSVDELENYLPCTAGASYPEIDFSKNSLLLAPVKNVAGCNIDSRTEKLLLKQLSASKYELAVYLIPVDTANTAPFFRHIAILVPKMAKTAVVDFTVIVNKLVGTWHEKYNHKDGVIYKFSNNDTLYINLFVYPSIIRKWKWTYHFISEDSIQIERLTENETNLYTRKTNSKVIFYNRDSVLIENFYPYDYEHRPPLFGDIKLFKIK